MNKMNADDKNSNEKWKILLIAVVFFAISFCLGSAASLLVKKLESSGSKDVEVTGELLDCNIGIDGVVYQIPCAVSEFLENGWTISSTYFSYDETDIFQNGERGSLKLCKDENCVYVDFRNDSEEQQLLKNCQITGLTCYRGACESLNVTLPQGITLESSVEEILSAYGEPYVNFETDEYYFLWYGDGDLFVEFQIFKGDEAPNSYIMIVNR